MCLIYLLRNGNQTRGQHLSEAFSSLSSAHHTVNFRNSEIFDFKLGFFLFHISATIELKTVVHDTGLVPDKAVRRALFT